MVGAARATFTIVILFIFTVPLIPVQIVLNALDARAKRQLPILWHQWAARLIGLKITVEGEMAHERPLLLTCNHVSWLDIVSLSASGPVSFIAKQEVSSWPAFGMLAKLQRTVFVNRERRSATGNKTNEIARRLMSGDAMVLFAEGTSTPGTHVLGFRSALLGAAQKAIAGQSVMWVQPVAIAYTKLHGMVMATFERPLTGFYGDMDMAPHLWNVLKEAAFDVTIVYGKPLQIDDTMNRKELSKQLEDAVRAMKTDVLMRKNHL